MNASLRPWGTLEWLERKLSFDAVHLITSGSFEDRAIALAEWSTLRPGVCVSASVLRITNPPSTSWEVARKKVDASLVQIQSLLVGVRTQIFDVDLLDSPSAVMTKDVLTPEHGDFVLLDVTAMPKRFFLFAVKRLLATERVRNLVVCYAQPHRYPEIALCGDAMPPGTMQGFARTDETRDERRLILGVGYVALSVDELLGTSQAKVDFLFPFPPASPGFRRSWKLLSQLMPQDLPTNTELLRIDGRDAFEVCSRLVAIGQTTDLDLVPLGPKPHALGMALAAIRLGGTAEIIYSQPRAYDVNYSTGISRDGNGHANIMAYCLKRDGAPTF